MDSLEIKIAKILKRKKKTLAVAESCTGGLIASRITDISGSSRYFSGGVVAYSNDVKTSVLKVPQSLIKEYGAVSRQVAQSMAEGIKAELDSDVAAAVTGIAGPTGGSASKPVGTAYIAVVSGKRKKTKKVNFKGTRREIKQKFAEAVLKLIAENI
ncbi:MAG: CinA family protein [Candidatus Omnitrophota bacterium]